jgi:hypothetical protein
MKIISKSAFIKGFQCTKSLYLSKYSPELIAPISSETEELFASGNEIGQAARHLFPGGQDAMFESKGDFNQALQLTQKWIQEGQKVIYEAAFQKNGLFCLVDILIRDNNKWKIYEVKSSTKVKKSQILDASFQYYTLKNAGFSIKDIFIVHLNSNYVRQEKLNYQELFSIQSVLIETLYKQDKVAQKIMELQQVLRSDKVPDQDIGPHCKSPYICNLYGHCWKHIPETSIFNISRLKSEYLWDLYNHGIIKIDDISSDYPLTYRQQLEIKCYKSGVPHINVVEINRFLNSLEYPLFFLDFETINPATPLYNGMRPYQMLTFQYSVHLQKKSNGSLKHFEFLGSPETDPRLELVHKLLRDTIGKGSILAYSASFEKGRLNELAELFPKYSDEIKNRISRIVDLIIPFRNSFYYDPKMKGSNSLKSVVPALIPEYSYNNLTVADGGQAMSAFSNLSKLKSLKEKMKVRQALLEYCGRDTLVMVKILDKFKEETLKAT